MAGSSRAPRHKALLTRQPCPRRHAPPSSSFCKCDFFFLFFLFSLLDFARNPWDKPCSVCCPAPCPRRIPSRGEGRCQSRRLPRGRVAPGAALVMTPRRNQAGKILLMPTSPKSPVTGSATAGQGTRRRPYGAVGAHAPRSPQWHWAGRRIAESSFQPHFAASLLLLMAPRRAWVFSLRLRDSSKSLLRTGTCLRRWEGNNLASSAFLWDRGQNLPQPKPDRLHGHY